MASVYAGRLRNARRIGWRVKRALAAGFMVLDDEGHRITDVAFKGFGAAIGLRFGCTVYMHSDPEMANGMELSKKAFNALFVNWRIVHPKHLKRFA